MSITIPLVNFTLQATYYFHCYYCAHKLLGLCSTTKSSWEFICSGWQSRISFWSCKPTLNSQKRNSTTFEVYIFWSPDCCLFTEPTVGPSSINATALTAFEIQVSWEPIQQFSTNGILRGYEVKGCRNTNLNACLAQWPITLLKLFFCFCFFQL